jgi:predicted DNA-binding transcriptional regulator AlpA
MNHPTQMVTEIPTIPETGFLRQKQVLKFIPISKSNLWLMVREGRFPRPIKLGPRTTVWKAEELQEFIKKHKS